MGRLLRHDWAGRWPRCKSLNDAEKLADDAPASVPGKHALTPAYRTLTGPVYINVEIGRDGEQMIHGMPLPVQVLRYMQQRPGKAYTAEEIATELKCSPRRAQTSLMRLVDEELIVLARSVGGNQCFIAAEVQQVMPAHYDTRSLATGTRRVATRQR